MDNDNGKAAMHGLGQLIIKLVSTPKVIQSSKFMKNSVVYYSKFFFFVCLFNN